MQILSLYCIAVYLVAGTNTRSVKSTYDKTSFGHLRDPLQTGANGNQAADICKLEKNAEECITQRRDCILDENETKGFRCVCKKGETEDDEGNCVDICKLEKNAEECITQRRDCILDENEIKGFRCVCKKGETEDDEKNCVDICKLEKNAEECTVRKRECILDENETKGFRCDCKKGETEDDEKNCVDVCDQEENINKCKGLNKVCERDESTEEGFRCGCRKGDVEINGECIEIPFPSTVTKLNLTSPSTAQTAATGTDPCIENPCQNGGTCVVLGNRSECLCRKPYLGILCETDPCDWNPCKNGGMCKTGNGTFKCYCKEPFSGEFCESRIKIDAYVITLVAASVFSAIVLIFVACVMCQRYRIMR